MIKFDVDTLNNLNGKITVAELVKAGIGIEDDEDLLKSLTEVYHDVLAAYSRAAGVCPFTMLDAIEHNLDKIADYKICVSNDSMWNYCEINLDGVTLMIGCAW